jgi:hypothetical protein
MLADLVIFAFLSFAFIPFIAEGIRIYKSE